MDGQGECIKIDLKHGNATMLEGYGRQFGGFNSCLTSWLGEFEVVEVSGGGRKEASQEY